MTDAAADPVLVTGAFGQAGSRCTEILLGRGRTVIAMDLRNDKTVAVAERLGAGAGPAQALLDFQHHDWNQTVSSIADAQGMRRNVLSVVGPLVRPVLRLVLKVQRRIEKRGRYADPWTLVGTKFGNDALAPTDF
jgi:NAD(P)-dependent dehydrogenase (short-subunit alcohol dehydrogenase family)